MADKTKTQRPPKGPRRKDTIVKNGLPPSQVRDADDPGDATQRNFRYQHAYGAILLIAGRRKLKPYQALWCEHHEDYLAQCDDGTFDAYQIKTSRPEIGAWTLTDTEVVSSIGRFLDLATQFPNHVLKFFFVSNTEPDSVGEVQDQKRRGRCPVLMLRHLQSLSSPAEISEPFAEAFGRLRGSCGCSDEQLFQTLKRTDFILGPSRSDFDASLSHEHLGRLEECNGYSAVQLDNVRDGLIAMIFRASSLQVTDPIRHLNPLVTGLQLADPTLTAKRLTIAEIPLQASAHKGPASFVFPGDPKIALGAPRPSTVLKQKLEVAGLQEEVEYLSERERAAEYNLLEDANLRSDQYPALLRQIEEKIRGECQEAHLRTRSEDGLFGRSMMIEVQDRLKRLAAEDPAAVGHHPYDCLLGVAALLTSECSVWWSSRFPLQSEDTL